MSLWLSVIAALAKPVGERNVVYHWEDIKHMARVSDCDETFRAAQKEYHEWMPLPLKIALIRRTLLPFWIISPAPVGRFLRNTNGLRPAGNG